MTKLLYQFAFILLIISSAHNTVFSQQSASSEMQAFSFLVGDWVGTSRAYEDGKLTRQIPAYEKISYQLKGNIITIDLHSEALQLHTIIYFDQADGLYHYNAYYPNGTGKYTAQLKDGKLVVSPSDTKRFIFHLTAEGDFQEYGEILVDGKWVKYFEDTFKKLD